MYYCIGDYCITLRYHLDMLENSLVCIKWHNHVKLQSYTKVLHIDAQGVVAIVMYAESHVSVYSYQHYHLPPQLL